MPQYTSQYAYVSAIVRGYHHHNKHNHKPTPYATTTDPLLWVTTRSTPQRQVDAFGGPIATNIPVEDATLGCG